MTNERGNPTHPPVVTQAAYQSELDKLRAREKAHTREGDAIAAARRRLPMVEVDASLPLTGPDGPLTLLAAFEGRRQLIAYYFMWYDGYPADRQCEGCTWCASQVGELSYLHSPGWPQDRTDGRTLDGPPTWTPVPEWPAGRPLSQWSRLAAGHSDDLTAAP